MNTVPWHCILSILPSSGQGDAKSVLNSKQIV